MALTTSKLRDNIYRILDRVLKTGKPVEIVRGGKRLKIVPVESKGKLDNLVKRPEYLRCDPEEIVHMDWSKQWRP